MWPLCNANPILWCLLPLLIGLLTGWWAFRKSSAAYAYAAPEAEAVRAPAPAVAPVAVEPKVAATTSHTRPAPRSCIYRDQSGSFPISPQRQSMP